MAFDPWNDDRSPRDLILERASVESLTEGVLEEFLRHAQSAIRAKDLARLMSLLDLEMCCGVEEFRNGKLQPVEAGRDAFLMQVGGMFELSTCEGYSLELGEIIELSSRRAEFTVVARDPELSRQNYFPIGEIRQRLIVNLFERRPVLSEVHQC